MALKFSTGLTAHLLSVGPLLTAMNSGMTLRVFSGPIPVHADDALDLGGTHETIRRIKVDGATDLAFELSGLQIQKVAADIWTDTASEEGYASFFRLTTGMDSGGALDNTSLRVQGTIGMSNASDLVLLNTFVASSAPLVVDSFIIVMPNQ